MTSPRQLRRQARKLHRHGIQPMILLEGTTSGHDTASLALARIIWRYRSELLPAFAAIALVIAGWRLHATRPHPWPLPLGVAVITAAAVALSGARAGLASWTERAYSALVALAAGSWLSAATIAGPGTAPLPQLLILGGPVLAVPWWAHRRRRAKVRVERKLEAWPDIAQATGLPGSRVMSAVVDLWGWRARIRLARGQTITDVLARIPALESALGTFRGAVRVYPTEDDMANRCELRVLEIDPHADAIPWPGPSVASITEPIELGPFEDAAPCRVLFLRRNTLIGGVTGSGKSGGLNVVIASLSACQDVVIWAIDLKRGIELGPWAPCLGRLATTPAQARALLRDAVAILEARAAQLAAEGRRTWEPSPERPALVIVIDEYAELADHAPGAMTDADSVARLGRTVAVNMIAATQRPTQKAMGRGAVRSQMDIRISFRVRERKDVDLVLGQGMLAAGWHAHTLNAPGKFLISAQEYDTPRRARAYLLTDQTVADIVTRYSALRPGLDEISLHAAGHGSPADDGAPPGTTPDGYAPDQAAPAGTDAQARNGGQGIEPEVMLWAALSLAPDEGISVPDLMTETGMSRRWIYYRLRELAASGRAVQTARGQWRAATPGGDHE